MLKIKVWHIGILSALVMFIAGAALKADSNTLLIFVCITLILTLIPSMIHHGAKSRQAEGKPYDVRPWLAVLAFVVVVVGAVFVVTQALLGRAIESSPESYVGVGKDLKQP